MRFVKPTVALGPKHLNNGAVLADRKFPEVSVIFLKGASMSFLEGKSHFNTRRLSILPILKSLWQWLLKKWPVSKCSPVTWRVDLVATREI